MRFAVLGSGSRGNSALVSSSDTRILIDCGFPLREIIKRLARLGLSPAQLDAILVTHEHADHIHGVELLARHYQIPVYLGMATAEVLECYRAVDALVVEANHDSTMLAGGPYPYFLKARVGGSRGHLNNHQSAELVKQLDWGRMQHLVLAHLSEKNNSPQLARQTFVDTLGCDPDWLQVADQHSGLDWREIA